MSARGQERRIGAVRNISALRPRADVGADIVEPPVSANSRPEQVQQTEQAYSITSSACCRNGSGMVRPSAFAVLRLTISWNLVGSWTGRSPGLAPLRMRSTYDAARR